MALGVKIPKQAFAQARQEFADGETGFQNVELDPGRYVGIAKKLRGVDTKNGPSIILDVKITGESEFAGKTAPIFFSTESDRMKWLLQALDRMGYDVSEFDNQVLEEVAEDIKKNTPVIRLTAKKSGDYVNLYVDKALPDLAAADLEEVANGEAEEDDEPKKKVKKKAAVEAEEDEVEAEAEEDDEETEEDEDEDEDEPPKKKVAGAGAGKVPKKPLKSVKKAAEEDDEETEEDEPSGGDDEVELTVGMKVTSVKKTWKGAAKILSVDEDAGTVRVKTAEGKLFKVGVDAIELPS